MLVVIEVAASASDNTDIWGYGSRRGGRDDSECVDANFQTASSVIARSVATKQSSSCRVEGLGCFACTRKDGARVRDLATPRARVLQEILAPSKERGRRECRMLDAPAASRAIKEKTHAHSQGPPKSHGIPCAMVLTAPPWSPWCTGLVSHHHQRELRPASQTPASGCQAPTALPSASGSVRQRNHPRPPQPVPRSTRSRNAPLVGSGWQLF